MVTAMVVTSDSTMITLNSSVNHLYTVVVMEMKTTLNH